MNLKPRHDNQEIMNELKDARGKLIKLPSQVDFGIVGERRDIYMPVETVLENMQDDNATFEGWALVFKSWLDREVRLDWEPPADSLNLHYQRFLYRAIRFNEGADWFSIGKHSRQYLADSLVLNPGGTPRETPGYFLVNVQAARDNNRNYPGDKPLAKMSENELEALFYQDCSSLLGSIGLDGSTHVFRKIPVGVFSQQVSGKTRVFPGGAGQVDLGAVNDAKEAFIFELKIPSNNAVGVISELLFYTHLFRDIQLGIFSHTESGNKFAHLVSETERVFGYVLAGQLNGSIDNPVAFELLNKAFASRNERFGFIQYKSSCKEIDCAQIY